MSSISWVGSDRRWSLSLVMEVVDCEAGRDMVISMMLDVLMVEEHCVRSVNEM